MRAARVPAILASDALGRARGVTLTYVLLFVLALGLRVTVLSWLGQDDPIPFASDMRTYYEQARGLIAGTWPPAEPFFYHPGMPYFVRASFALFGVSTFAPRLLNCVLSALSCTLTAALGTRLFGRRAGLFAGALLAVHESSVYYAAQILDVPMTSCALVALVWLAAIPSLPAAIAVGVLSGIAVLGRGSLLLCTAALLAQLLLRRRFTIAAAFATAFLITLAPVLARNAAYGCACLSTNLSLNFFIGNNARAPGYWAFELAPTDPPLTSSAWLWRAFDFIASDPARWTGLALHKLFLFLLVPDGVVPEQANIVMEGVFYVPWLSFLPGTLTLAAAALAGIWRARRDRKPLGALAAIWVSYSASVVLFFYADRFRAPVVTLYALLAAYALDGLLRRRSIEPAS